MYTLFVVNRKQQLDLVRWSLDWRGCLQVLGKQSVARVLLMTHLKCPVLTLYILPLTHYDWQI